MPDVPIVRACLAAITATSMLVAGCHSSGTSSEPADAQADGAMESGPGDAGSSPDADAGTGYPIRYVVVLVKENHTFDSLFGAYPGANGAMTATLSDGGTLTRPTMPPGLLPGDLSHFHADALTAYDDGGMNGFDLVVQGPASDGSEIDPLLPFRYYTSAEIPNYYNYAGHYALCDAFFTTVLSDSFPAYMSLIAAQSPAYEDPPGSVWSCYAAEAGVTVPTYDPGTCAASSGPPCFSIPTIVDNLPAGVTWRSYTDQYGTGPLSSPFDAIASLNAQGTSANTRLNGALLTDLAAGDLANITYVWGGNDSEHPPQDVCAGENDTVAIATALMQGPHWNESLLIVTYDDWGGFYDHVAPTASPCPNGGGPFSTGFRVPTLLISPWARKGLVYHTPTEQASIPRLIEDLFGLPRMSSLPGSTARDGTAGDLLGAFDFGQTASPGLILKSRTCP